MQYISGIEAYTSGLNANTNNPMGSSYNFFSDDDINYIVKLVDGEVKLVDAPYMDQTEYKAATYEEDGNIEYYTYEDASGNFNHYYTYINNEFVEIAAKDTVIPKLTMYMQIDTNSGSSGNVDVNYLVPLPHDADLTKDTYKLCFGDKEVNVNDCATTTDPESGRTYYLLKVAAPAKEMADSFAYSVKKGENTVNSGSTSIRDYADTVLAAAEGTYSAKVLKTCRAMLAYGAAAQTLFNYNNENAEDLADSGITGFGLDYSGVDLAMNETFDADSLKVALANAPVEYYGMNMNLDCDTYIQLAFRIKSGDQDSAINYITNNFTFGGKAAVVEKNDNTDSVVVKSPAITIDDLVNDIALVYGGKTYNVNAKQYMTKVNEGSNVALKNVCKALYNYYLAATNRL